jgi:hypothetical protein
MQARYKVMGKYDSIGVRRVQLFAPFLVQSLRWDLNQNPNRKGREETAKEAKDWVGLTSCRRAILIGL